MLESCTFVAQTGCNAAAGGTFTGNGITCTATVCPGSCSCDWNHDGYVNANDFYAFQNDWLAGHADINHSGMTDNQDWADFFTCYNSTSTPGCVHH